MKNKKSSKKQRHGFIGPLGDDIPSIFPLTLGIVIFMSTLIYINNATDVRNNEFTLRRATLALSYLATEKGTYEIKEFQNKCNTSFIPLANQYSVNFAITMKRHCKKIDLFSTNPFYSDYANNDGLCTNAKLSPALSTITDYASAKQFFPNNTVVLNYPVAVPCPNEGDSSLGLGVMNVIAWPRTK